MSSIDDHIRKYIETGDRKWFALIYEQTMPRIYRYFYIKTMQRELSEDLTSEVFIRVYRNLNSASLDQKTFISWIYRIAHNLLVDHLRKENKMGLPAQEFSDNTGVPDEEVLKQKSAYLKKELDLQRPGLVSAIGTLTGLQKDVIILRFVEDMDYTAIARIFGKNRGTIRGIVFRAVEKIRKEMSRSDG